MFPELPQVFHSDGKYWQPGPGKKHHLSQVNFSRDIVNVNPAEETLWGDGEFDSSCWFFHHQPGYLGNEGNEEEKIYSRYILTFCRREAVDAYQLEDAEVAEQEQSDQMEQRKLDREEANLKKQKTSDQRSP